MIIILKPNARPADAKAIMKKISRVGLKPLYLPGVERIVLGAIGDERILRDLNLESEPMVDVIKPILSPYKLVSREMHPEDTLIDIEGIQIGDSNFTVIAGPCSVEDRRQIMETARIVKQYGAVLLRGGVFKPRSSPYSFQGLGEEGFKLLKEASEQYRIPTVTEILDEGDLVMADQYVSVLQIGARNMQNFRLLKAVGKSTKPVLLKRGMSSTIEELLLAAEYIYYEGNHNIILCERGIRTFETATRNTLDLNAVAYLKLKTHLPVFVDPSHGTGIKELISPMARAAAACGADGLLVEVHVNPREALSDGYQSLDEAEFAEFMTGLDPFVRAAGKSFNSGQGE